MADPPRAALRFDGEIAGAGTSSGTRIVLGMWADTPFGPITDVMLERGDGHRVLVAPSDEVARFIATTYSFDEIRVEPTRLETARASRTVVAGSVRVTVRFGRRTAVGQLLRLVPRRVARTALWCRLIDPFARRLRRGVRTVGTAGNGRREYYCALDEHAVVAVTGSWDGVELGDLRAVEPPVRFGFGSTPSTPSMVRVTTLIRLPAQDAAHGSPLSG